MTVRDKGSGRDGGVDAPGVLVLPPVLYTTALGLGLLLHFLAPRQPLTPWVARSAGVLLVAAGAALGMWGERTMHHGGTNVSPKKPSLTVISDGPFRFTRNPLYVALICLYLGVTLLVDALWPLLLLIPVVAITHYGIILREERYLEAKFGDAYRAYKQRVRRWL